MRNPWARFVPHSTWRILTLRSSQTKEQTWDNLLISHMRMKTPAYNAVCRTFCRNAEIAESFSRTSADLRLVRRHRVLEGRYSGAVFIERAFFHDHVQIFLVYDQIEIL